MREVLQKGALYEKDGHGGAETGSQFPHLILGPEGVKLAVRADEDAF